MPTTTAPTMTMFLVPDDKFRGNSFIDRTIDIIQTHYFI
jgi:hypothetical protein